MQHTHKHNVLLFTVKLQKTDKHYLVALICPWEEGDSQAQVSVTARRGGEATFASFLHIFLKVSMIFNHLKFC